MERRSVLYDISGVTRDKSMHLKAENWTLTFPDAKNLIFTCVDPFPTMGAHLATLSGNMSVVNQIIASDFQVDARDSYGNTMLHYAAVSDNTTMEKLITETYGANPTLVNNAKQTPADVKKTRRLCMIQHASFVPPFGGKYLPCQPMSTEEITRSLLDIDNRNAMLQELNKSFISKHEQVRLANLHEVEERLHECTRFVQLIEMKISVSVDDTSTSKLKEILTTMKDNETELKKIKLKIANASLT